MPPESTAGSMPLRARLSLLRQHAILTLRWWFRLPIDEIKERNVQTQIDNLLALNSKQLQTITTMTRLLSLLQARLQWYETHIPRMRELKREYEREQEKLRSLAQSSAQETSERLTHGIVGNIGS